MTIHKFKNETPASIGKKLERKPKKQKQSSYSIIKMTTNKNRDVKRTKSLPPIHLNSLQSHNSHHVSFSSQLFEEPEDLETVFTTYIDTLLNGKRGNGSLFDEGNLNSDYTTGTCILR
ncbi:33797_t:CDS:1 [Gigaspora margarita]|uniref:33797_t:CDS:1 n=1 Tax=Gigaspora margarita TaxID=4874 RepID=A0ABN7VWR6_GIGMA|nr:33797_t:CDS:1 [Gigaspora margarita]